MEERNDRNHYSVEDVRREYLPPTSIDLNDPDISFLLEFDDSSNAETGSHVELQLTQTFSSASAPTRKRRYNTKVLIPSFTGTSRIGKSIVFRFRAPKYDGCHGNGLLIIFQVTD